MNDLKKIGLGGGCHWCTEGVFSSLLGVEKVEQGWISSLAPNESLSEGVLVYYDPEIITLTDLIEIHLYTHASTSNHSFREKYRSAVYTFAEEDRLLSNYVIKEFQKDFDAKIITKVLSFDSFELNSPEQLNYFYSRPRAVFCERYIHPKLEVLKSRFSKKMDVGKMERALTKE